MKRLYDYDISDRFDTENKIQIHISHNRRADQVIRHVPQMTPIDLISGMGGLVGMWLGLDIMGIFIYFVSLFAKLIRKI